nr:hypothetical protein [Chlamydiota bacterium]
MNTASPISASQRVIEFLKEADLSDEIGPKMLTDERIKQCLTRDGWFLSETLLGQTKTYTYLIRTRSNPDENNKLIDVMIFVVCKTDQAYLVYRAFKIQPLNVNPQRITIRIDTRVLGRSRTRFYSDDIPKILGSVFSEWPLPLHEKYNVDSYEYKNFSVGYQFIIRPTDNPIEKRVGLPDVSIDEETRGKVKIFFAGYRDVQYGDYWKNIYPPQEIEPIEKPAIVSEEPPAIPMGQLSGGRSTG